MEMYSGSFVVSLSGWEGSEGGRELTFSLIEDRCLRVILIIL